MWIWSTTSPNPKWYEEGITSKRNLPVYLVHSNEMHRCLSFNGITCSSSSLNIFFSCSSHWWIPKWSLAAKTFFDWFTNSGTTYHDIDFQRWTTAIVTAFLLLPPICGAKANTRVNLMVNWNYFCNKTIDDGIKKISSNIHLCSPSSYSQLLLSQKGIPIVRSFEVLFVCTAKVTYESSAITVYFGGCRFSDHYGQAFPSSSTDWLND